MISRHINHQLPLMKSLLLFAFLPLVSYKSQAQQVDSIFFHLYTDSLKKGTYNYINVDGKLNTGRWLPLTSKDITFSASAGRFEGNSLFVERDFTGDSITVKAILKSNPQQTKEVTIYIKRKDDNGQLKTMDEVLQSPPSRKRKSRLVNSQ
jgi:hypothetical protein